MSSARSLIFTIFLIRTCQSQLLVVSTSKCFVDATALLTAMKNDPLISGNYCCTTAYMVTFASIKNPPWLQCVNATSVAVPYGDDLSSQDFSMLDWCSFMPMASSCICCLHVPNCRQEICKSKSEYAVGTTIRPLSQTAISGGAIAGIAIGLVAGLALCIGMGGCCSSRRRKYKPPEQDIAYHPANKR